MTQSPEKAESRWAELSDEVLESVEASRKQAIDGRPQVRRSGEWRPPR